MTPGDGGGAERLNLAIARRLAVTIAAAGDGNWLWLSCVEPAADAQLVVIRLRHGVPVGPALELLRGELRMLRSRRRIEGVHLRELTAARRGRDGRLQLEVHSTLIPGIERYARRLAGALHDIDVLIATELALRPDA